MKLAPDILTEKFNTNKFVLRFYSKDNIWCNYIEQSIKRDMLISL